MGINKLSASRARQILAAAQKTRVLVVGDVMLDQFIWGGVSRISPEAPVFVGVGTSAPIRLATFPN